MKKKVKKRKINAIAAVKMKYFHLNYILQNVLNHSLTSPPNDSIILLSL